jgi:hypothetical protein
MTNNYSRDGGFLMLSLPLPLALLRFPSFAIGIVGVDEIEKES